MMKTKLITAPIALPVTLAEAQGFFRVIGAEYDADINRALSTATAKAEQITNRQLEVATYAGYLDAFQSSIALPKPPFKTVSKVEYIDKDGATKTFSDYYIDDVAVPAKLYFNSFPSDVNDDGVNNVIITFDCGYTTVPDTIKSWILAYALTLFENREHLLVGATVTDEPSKFLKHLLDDYRIIPV